MADGGDITVYGNIDCRPYEWMIEFESTPMKLVDGVPVICAKDEFGCRLVPQIAPGKMWARAREVPKECLEDDKGYTSNG